MALVLPLRSDSPHFSYAIELEGTTFVFEFKWNARDAGWYLNLADADGSILLAGLRVVVSHLYLWRFRMLGLPKGELEFIDTTGQDEDPTLTDLGLRVVALYTPSADFPEGYGR